MVPAITHHNFTVIMKATYELVVAKKFYIIGPTLR